MKQDDVLSLIRTTATVLGAAALISLAITVALESRVSREAMGPAAEITMANKRFEPGTVTVKAGSTVVWRNSSEQLHTVTSAGSTGSPVFDSASMSPGELFRQTFKRPGRYPYICGLHDSQGMKGEIVVVR